MKKVIQLHDVQSAIIMVAAVQITWMNVADVAFKPETYSTAMRR